MSNVTLNKNLIKKQGLNQWDVVKLENLHRLMGEIFDDMEYYYDPEKHLFELTECAKIVESLEFLMQAAWKFDTHKDFHTYWYRVPYCQCPVMDNDDAMGTGYHTINLSCPLHGGRFKDTKIAKPLIHDKTYWFDDSIFYIKKAIKWVVGEWKRG